MSRKTPTPEELQLQASIRAQYPYLVARDEIEEGKKISSAALASKNIRRLLKHEFPGVKFRAQCDLYANGSSVYIHWDLREGAPTGPQVDRLVEANFSYARFDGMTDSTDYDRDDWRDAFRSLFGSAGYVSTQPRKLTPDEEAAMNASILEKATQSAPLKSRKRRL